MKKFLAGMIAVLLLMGLTAPVFATSTSSDNTVEIVGDNVSTIQTQNMTVQFKVQENYKVIIPASVSLSNVSGKYEGTAPISTYPNLSSGKLNVVISNSGWSDPQYYSANANDETVEFVQGTPFSKVTYNVNSDNSQGVKYTLSNDGSNFFQAFTGTDKSGILIISTDTSASASVKFSAESNTENNALSAGTYSYPQTFKIWVE